MTRAQSVCFAAVALRSETLTDSVTGRDTSKDSELENYCEYEAQGLENAGTIVKLVGGDSITLALNAEGQLYGTGTFRVSV
jgi:hypothetical protein